MALELTENLTPTKAMAVNAKARSGIKIAAKDRQFFSEQLGLLLDTGTNLHAGLATMSRQCREGKLKQLINDLGDHISEGRTFSEALERHPESFSTTFTNLVKAGENGGFLPKVLEQLIEMEERREKLRSEVMSALSYPMFLMVFSLGVVIFILVVVFPKFATMFTSIADRLPATTIFLMWASDVIRNNYIVICAGMAGGLFVLYRWVKSEQGGLIMDRMALRAPILRSVFVPLYLIQSLRVMGLSLGNGVGILETLNACREIVPNRLFARFINSVENSVNDGAGLANGFRRASFMPDIVKEMIATGEETGALPKVMDRIARHYENELEKRLAMVARTAEPVMLVFMGLVVGVLVSSLILPIFQLSGSVG